MYGHEELRKLKNLLYIGELIRYFSGSKIACTVFQRQKSDGKASRNSSVSNFITTAQDIAVTDNTAAEEIFFKSFKIVIRTVYADSPPV